MTFIIYEKIHYNSILEIFNMIKLSKRHIEIYKSLTELVLDYLYKSRIGEAGLGSKN